jgi:hypothetical protein
VEKIMPSIEEAPDWVDDEPETEYSVDDLPKRSAKEELAQLNALANTVSQCAQSMAVVFSRLSANGRVGNAHLNHTQALMWLEMEFNLLSAALQERAEEE